jgi:hypothetical protein
MLHVPRHRRGSRVDGSSGICGTYGEDKGVHVEVRSNQRKPDR